LPRPVLRAMIQPIDHSLPKNLPKIRVVGEVFMIGGKENYLVSL
jgi:hypothetical protein